MFFIIYETKCLLNGKTYIGKHKTKDLHDGYIGSGKLLKRAVSKHGIENFSYKILHVYDVLWKMNLAERILVTPDLETSYNLCPGGGGGYEYINKIVTLAQKRLKISKSLSGRTLSKECKDKISKAKSGKAQPKNRGRTPWNKGLSKETHPALAALSLKAKQNCTSRLGKQKYAALVQR
jgi:hypothetical protein